ncbi:hypothetical protein JOM56_008116 [Amanita muscaria]
MTPSIKVKTPDDGSSPSYLAEKLGASIYALLDSALLGERSAVHRNQQIQSEFELQSTQSSKDPSQYTQCWCHKCRGGTVTKRTERNHRESPRAANAPETVLHNQRKLRNSESRTPVENNMNHVSEGHHITRIYERNEAAVDRSTKKRRLDEQQPNDYEIDSDPLDEDFTPDGPSGIEFDVELFFSNKILSLGLRTQEISTEIVIPMGLMRMPLPR